MKKILYFTIFFIVCVMVNIIGVDAYSCAYKFDYKLGVFGWNKETDVVKFDIDTSNKIISTPDGFFDKPVYFLDYYINSKYTMEYIVDSLNGGCPPNVIIGGISYNSGVSAYAIFFEESNFYQLEKKNILGSEQYMLPTIQIDGYYLIGSIAANAVAIGEYYKEESTGESVQSDFGCEYYDDILERLKELKCKKKGVSCNTSEIQEYNTKSQSLKTFCNSVTKYANIGLSSCLVPCLSLGEELSNNEDLVSFSNCGFSEKLTLYIANIVKWLKYIIPVIVIVLGILDFIQAIAAEKDDEMKKAQGRFIKRLIAAALIFIIPFIIEFVLNKMGFVANGCGIIDL